jgi:hypothetical protein
MIIRKRGRIWRDERGRMNTEGFEIEGGDLGEFEAWCEQELARSENQSSLCAVPLIGALLFAMIVIMVVLNLRRQ